MITIRVHQNQLQSVRQRARHADIEMSSSINFPNLALSPTYFVYFLL